MDMNERMMIQSMVRERMLRLDIASRILIAKLREQPETSIDEAVKASADAAFKLIKAVDDKSKR